MQKHLSKLFDNMSRMKFDTDAEGNLTKIGRGMYSKEEEFVPFSQSCDCSGQVPKQTSPKVFVFSRSLRDLLSPINSDPAAS